MTSLPGNRKPSNTTGDLLDVRVAATREWLIHVVIGLDLCPFAAAVHRQGELVIEAIEADSEGSLSVLIETLQRMHATESPESVILVLPDHFASFDYYVDFIARAEKALAAQGYKGEFQLASFHPDYCFADADSDDPANYTNRSPYPLLHVLRESSVARAIESHRGDTLDIPQRNQRITRELGLQKMQQLVAACKLAPPGRLAIGGVDEEKPATPPSEK